MALLIAKLNAVPRPNLDCCIGGPDEERFHEVPPRALRRRLCLTPYTMKGQLQELLTRGVHTNLAHSRLVRAGVLRARFGPHGVSCS